MIAGLNEALSFFCWRIREFWVHCTELWLIGHECLTSTSITHFHHHTCPRSGTIILPYSLFPNNCWDQSCLIFLYNWHVFCSFFLSVRSTVCKFRCVRCGHRSCTLLCICGVGEGYESCNNCWVMCWGKEWVGTVRRRTGERVDMMKVNSGHLFHLATYTFMNGRSSHHLPSCEMGNTYLCHCLQVHVADICRFFFFFLFRTSWGNEYAVFRVNG